MIQLSNNFTREELIDSVTATRLGIDNTPSREEDIRLCHLACFVLQPLRDRYKKPIRISSGYRCKELNKAVNGSPTS